MAEVFNLWFVEISETISEATMTKENMFIHCIEQYVLVRLLKGFCLTYNYVKAPIDQKKG